MIYICENCNFEHDGSYGSGRFCSKKCAKGFSTKEKRILINKKVSKTLKEKPKLEAPIFEYICEKCRNTFFSTKIRDNHKKHCNNCKRTVVHFKSKEELNTILDLAKTTVVKILHRAKRKCEICGWDKASLDIHHIDGKKIKHPNALKNLVILCPNCHRLVGANKISKEELKKISMDKTFSNWFEFYHPSN